MLQNLRTLILKCPICGNTDDFIVSRLLVTHVDTHGNMIKNSSFSYSDIDREDDCMCTKCKHEGIISEFNIHKWSKK